MRIFLIAIALIMACGTALYMVKYNYDSRHDELARIEAEIRHERQQAAILNAEWSYLTRPQRILNLSTNLLSLQPISTDRVVPLEAIPFREIREAE